MLMQVILLLLVWIIQIWIFAMCSLQVHRRILSSYSDCQSLEASSEYNVHKYCNWADYTNTAQREIFVLQKSLRKR